MSLKDELNGLFNDRKMVTRAEQRAMENKVSDSSVSMRISRQPRTEAITFFFFLRRLDTGIKLQNYDPYQL
jgi:hypothetical protein